MKKGTDYTVSYKNNKNIGKAIVTIKGIGSYAGSVKKAFKINPPVTELYETAYDSDKNVKLGWDVNTKVDGYEIFYSESGGKYSLLKNIEDSTINYFTAKDLKKGKSYDFKIRGYKILDKVKYYSAYSKVASIINEVNFMLNGITFDAKTMGEKWKGSDNIDSDGDGKRENVEFSLLIEIMGKRPEQLANIATIEFMDGTKVTKKVGDLVSSVVVHKVNGKPIADKWEDSTIRFRFICNTKPMKYVKSIVWEEK